MTRTPIVRLFSGRIIDPFDLQLDEVDIHDIAHHTSHICRYNGGTKYHFSVAQHQINLAVVVPQLMQHAGMITDQIEYNQIGKICLLHDAVETYTGYGDMISPMKRELGLDDRFEDNLLEVIFQKFNLPFSGYQRIKHYDKAICENEKLILFPHYQPTSQLLPIDLVIPKWTPEHAEKQYLAAFRALFDEGVDYVEH